MTDVLTGAIRFRSERHWRRERLVLQVETRWEQDDYDGSYIHTFKGVSWRDATTEDLTAPVLQKLLAGGKT